MTPQHYATARFDGYNTVTITRTRDGVQIGYTTDADAAESIVAELNVLAEQCAPVPDPETAPEVIPFPPLVPAPEPAAA